MESIYNGKFCQTVETEGFPKYHFNPIKFIPIKSPNII